MRSKYIKLAAFFLALLVLSLTACSMPPKVYSNDFEVAKNETYDNLKFADNVYYFAPERSSGYHSIHMWAPDILEPKEFYDRFMSDLAYFFSDKTIDDNYIYYRPRETPSWGDDEERPQIDFPIKDNFDEVMSGNVDFAFFMLETSGTVGLDWSKPTGNDFYYLALPNALPFRMNRGGIYNALYANPDYPRENLFPVASWLPQDPLELVDSLPFDSTKSYKLSDKEMSIADGVKMLEEYFTKVPAYKDKPLKVTVVGDVNVFKIDDNSYCYVYNITDEYDGIPFDYGNPGSLSEYNYNRRIEIACVYETDNVDIFLGTAAAYGAEVIDTFDTIIPVGQAISLISEKMSKSVEFEVQKVELLYTSKYVDEAAEDWTENATIAWKLTCYNANDKRIYHAYVDAKDGENFRYYTTNSEESEE
ncbi:hypothetical protein FACS1894217_12840 [Clostridia bacterium]|nr:hypothetical protein FACS1894217_12840 [Clostridia bacterium]